MPEPLWIILYLALVLFVIFMLAYWLDHRDRRGKVPKAVVR